MSSIKNVAIAGASGSMGAAIVNKLLAAGDFNVKALRRLGSKATFPSNVEVADVDFTSVESLTSALAGQDAVVSAIGTMDILGQIPLIDAALAANVKRFIPSEFGCDLENPKVRQLPVFGHKVQIEDYLEEKTKNSPMTYTFIFNVAFLDWGLEQNFLLAHKDGNPTIYGDGNHVFSATTLPTVADAVVGILRKPEETKNRAVRIEDAKISQNSLLAMAKQVAPEKKWQISPASVDEVVAAADARLAKGIIDMETMVPYLVRALLDPSYGAAHEKTDNELLGLKGKTDQEVLEIVRQYVK